jgi:hypothetical protein
MDTVPPFIASSEDDELFTVAARATQRELSLRRLRAAEKLRAGGRQGNRPAVYRRMKK